MGPVIRGDRAPDPGPIVEDRRIAASWPVAVALGAASWAAGLIHLAFMREHLEEYVPFGAFFLVSGVFQVVWAVIVFGRRSRAYFVLGLVANAAFAGPSGGRREGGTAVATTRDPSGVPSMLTKEGKALLERRAERLRTEVLPGIVARLEEQERDAQVEAEYRRATDELADIEYLIRHAPVAEETPGDPQVIEIGDEVTVGFEDGSTERYLIVHPIEATLDDLRISAESPLARALLGHRIGDRVEVAAPAGPYRCTIVAARVRDQQGSHVPQAPGPA
ncbi:MAG: GreA/GreB family elongation factor [Candidatus Velamenicoccus archaeovorus]